MLRAAFRLPAFVLVLAMAGWGCGSSAESGSVDRSPSGERRSTGPLKVAAVDGRVGDATAASSGSGVVELKVRRRPTDPGAAREGVGSGDSCPDSEVMPAGDNLAVVASATLCLVNGERAAAGLPPLTGNAKLDRSSLGHTQDMVANGYFAHQGRDGRDVVARVRATGYIPLTGGWIVGENLAWGTGTLATPKGVVQAWMDSQGHRENILRSGFKEAGLGIALGNPASDEGATYTMNFGATGGNVATQVVSTLTEGISPPRQSDPAPAPSTSTRGVAGRRLRACRKKALRTRSSGARRAKLARCARTARRVRR